jgi:hypothetical protein
VPAGLEERRFAVIDVGDQHTQDNAYFQAIIDQMKHGGNAALLHHLLNWDVSQVDLRKLPHTAALQETKIMSMQPVVKFWFERLWVGCLREEDGGWVGGVACDDFHSDYVAAAKKTGVNHHSTETELGIWLNKLVPTLLKKKKTILGQQRRCWVFPSLAACRVAFDERTGTPWAWPSDDHNEGGVLAYLSNLHSISE